MRNESARHASSCMLRTADCQVKQGTAREGTHPSNTLITRARRRSATNEETAEMAFASYASVAARLPASPHTTGPTPPRVTRGAGTSTRRGIVNKTIGGRNRCVSALENDAAETSSSETSPPPLPPYSLLSVPVYSLATVPATGLGAADSAPRPSMNITTYCCPVTIKQGPFTSPPLLSAQLEHVMYRAY